MLEYIAQHLDIVVTMILSSLVGYLISRVKNVKCEYDYLKKGMQVLLATNIDSKYEFIIPRGTITPRERNIVTNLGEAYKAVEGNHGYDTMVKEMDALPTDLDR